MAKALAKEIVKELYDRDAVLCSVPHGQYETYQPHYRDRDVEIVQEVLDKLGIR